MKNSTIGIGLMGLGVVAGQVAKILKDTNKIKMLSESAGFPLTLRKIKILDSDLKRPLANEIDSKLLTTDENEFFNTEGIDIVVEAIGGENPSFNYLKKAIKSGKHIVTSNKEVIAKHGIELLSLAEKHNIGLHYEASVGGGIPLINPFQTDLIANRINSIYAIINGTTNYILTRMAKENCDFAVALKNAQELGYAEANPKNDIEGIDATYKLAILASLAFHCKVRPEDIYCEGISKLSGRDFQYARELGFAVKLLAIGKREDSNIQVRVHPVFTPEDTLLAKVDGVFNAIQIEGDLIGKLIFYGKGAGALPTSSAVISDIVAAAKDIVCGKIAITGWKIDRDIHIKPMTFLETRYYLRMEVDDSPGVLAQIAQVLGNQHISIYSVIQKEADEETGTAEIVIMTHPAQEQAMQKALTDFNKLKVVKQVSNFVRVEDIN
jgi:homoserine dehydrogenase